MAYRLGVFSEIGLDEAFLRLLIAEHRAITLPRLERLWMYYRNPQRASSPGADLLRRASVADPAGAAPWPASDAVTSVLGQEIGLPSRITGRTSDPAAPATRREVVIENDIGWRIQTMVDFMFGKPVRIASLAIAEPLRDAIETILDRAWEASGGISLLQDAALLGHVFGSVEFLVSIDGPGLRAVARSMNRSDPRSWADAAAACISIEVVDPRRGVPLTDPSDYRRLLAYIIHHDQEVNKPADPAWWEKALGVSAPTRRARAPRTRIITAGHWQQYDQDKLVAEGDTPWTGGRVPVVHIQNTAEPWKWWGLGEVEPLIPLQNELNTRLSDRAHRVTMQSFKMYLAKGLEGFDKVPVAPGQVWSTDNPDASVQAFGGDAASPSEDEHIRQIREGLDKISGLPPVAGGVVQGKIGNLSSANALRVTLMSVLAKTARKRVTYGRGIAEVCELILAALHWAGVLGTNAAERRVRLEWPDPLPTDDRDRVLAAEGKARLGVPQERVLSELGYSNGEAGIE